MNEFGETETIYVWPKDHVEGEPYPEDFRDRLAKALAAADIEWENV